MHRQPATEAKMYVQRCVVCKAEGVTFVPQVCSEAVHHCTESCEDMHCTARARSVEAASSDMDTGAFMLPIQSTF